MWRFKLARLLLVVCAASGPGLSAAYGQDEADSVHAAQTSVGPVADPADDPKVAPQTVSQEEQALIDALSQVENLGTGSDKLVVLVGKATALGSLPSDFRDRLAVAVLDWTKPLPASNIEGNIAGYTALANLQPENSTYSAKRDSYVAKLKLLRASVLKKYKTETDDFNGTVWYTHRNVPRYADSRPYVSLYLGKKDGGTPTLRFVLHYTTRNGWLFVESAQANIDGEIVTIPSGDWKRDNDTETWEWIDEYAPGTRYMDIARRIAASTKTVIRFQGQQNVEDYTVKSEDKDALRDGLLAYEVMVEQADQ